MKTILQFLAALTVLAFSSAPSLVRAQDVPPPPPDNQGDQSDQGASFQTFYDQLGDQGTWVQTDDYGYVFQPNVSDSDWAPYTDGHWVYTDVGWTWVSDEPWGWATYHYGRWANIDGMGWVWVPGYRWAPAWVSWRYGGGYCGWAPLPPETLEGVGIGFHFGGDADVSFNIGPGFYNFVAVGDMGEPNYRGHFIDHSRNYEVINNTTNITNINGGTSAGFRGVVVKGPLLSEVNAHSHQHIPTVQLTAANQPGRSSLQGNSLAVYAPKINPGTVQQAKPTRVSQTIAHPTFNRGDSITKPLAVTATVKPLPPSAAAIQAAQTAQLHAPAKAKIATEKTTVTPLTSLKPVAPVPGTANVANPGVNAFNGANTVKPKTEEHTSANAPFTGESVKPAVTQPNEVKPTPKVYPQTESSGSQVYHPTSTPSTETYHPQTQSSGGQTYHPSSTPPTETYHPQQQAQPQQPAHQQQQQPQPQQPAHQQQPNYKSSSNTNNAPGH